MESTAISNNINVLSKKKYIIRKNGVDITKISINQLINKIQDESIINDYGYGSQIVLPYIDSNNNIEYELPFNFGTMQTFIAEDYSTFNGLGLVAEYGIPARGIQFDAPEPNNKLNNNITIYGNNRYQYSNLRQWLNKRNKNWYEDLHIYDTPPTLPNPSNSTGFLSCLPEDFVDAVIPVKNSTKTVNSYYKLLDATFDKFFPLSLSQSNIKCTDTNIGLNDNTEGRYWEYWHNKNIRNAYWSGNKDNTGEFASNDSRVVYSVENHNVSCMYVLRSAYFSTMYTVWSIGSRGEVGLTCSSYIRRVVPACVIG